jgi:NADH dehydrogenase (ubiquinone) 1 alpha subcomplex subunit 9
LTQPVFVGDVARTILRVIDEPDKYQGKQIDCFGPNDYTYMELAKFVNDITERDMPIFNLPQFYYSKLANVLQYQREPLLTPDLVELMTEDNMPSMTPEEYKNSDVLTMQDLGIEPMALEKQAFDWLHHYRVGGHFHRVQGYH